MTKAERAVRTMIKRIRDDGRVAYLVGPCSQAYEDLTEAYAEMIGKDVDAFRVEFEAIINPVDIIPPYEDARRTLEECDRVEFEVGQSDRGPKAINVKLLKS